jgi:hypothetical protein
MRLCVRSQGDKGQMLLEDFLRKAQSFVESKSTDL